MTTNYIKVDKRNARKLFEAGKTIFLLPCKASLNSYWFTPYRIQKNENSLSFDKIVNSFEYYNCNSQLGRYTSFYTES